MSSCNLCEAPITQGKTPHTICAECGTSFCAQCTDKNLAQCPKCGFG